MTLRGTQPVRARPRLFHFPTVVSNLRTESLTKKISFVLKKNESNYFLIKRFSIMFSTHLGASWIDNRIDCRIVSIPCTYRIIGMLVDMLVDVPVFLLQLEAEQH